jgi:N-methylhydantoinase A
MDGGGRRPWRIGIDVGGTFTDGLLWNAETGAVAATKVLSTPDDPGRAFLAACERLLAENGAAPAEISYIVHGTTVATNAVLQRRLAPVAFVTTAGFADLLEIARQVRPDPYDVFAEKPKPLVGRALCLEVVERLDAEGGVLTPLDEGSVAAAAARIAAAGVAAVAVCLLHAYRNPAHERRVGALLRRHLPGVAVSLSSDLAAEFREYPRACTAIVNAGLAREVSGYLEGLGRALDRRGVAGERLVMQSNGGIADFAHSAARPVFLIESGPAAGVVGAAHLARALGEDSVVSFDMGGTTAKVGLVREGLVHRVHEFEVGVDSNRARQWFAGAAGYPILTPAVDLVEIGTGGGSVAWIDDGGQLRVGPRSAGADPGPACYGRGGAEPTITDADLVLGRLNKSYFLGGEMTLDEDAAERAVGGLAARLGLDAVACARGIVEIADAAMSQALRVVSVQRGYDPRDFKLVAFGGAGPLHACAIAEAAGIPAVLVPTQPGIASAFGLLVADLKHDFAATRVLRADGADPETLEATLAGLEAEGRAALAREGVPASRMRFDRSVDARYVGQSFQLPIALPPRRLTVADVAAIRRRFDEQHRATYGYAEPREPCELVALRVAAVGEIGQPPLADAPAGGSLAPKQRRRAFFAPAGFVDCAVHERAALPFGAAIDGPAIVEERDSATAVPPGWTATVAAHGILALARRAGGAWTAGG